ncbi:MAG: PHP domain-containing protein [Lentisphaeria bacterium]|nr:PHP domain-containing protein [Lentisphaeria bacterium]
MIDLHVHSTASDGSTPPGELPAMAAAAGLTAVALTDHDTVSGVAEFLEAGKAFPDLETIAGVELSCQYCSREMHIVGLFLNPENEEFQDYLNRQREERRERAERIRTRLTSLGYPVSWEDLRLAGAECSPGRPHFAKVLVEKYGFPDMQSVFQKLLKRGAAAYVPRQLPPPPEAIRAIHAAGGVAVWAHPVYREKNERAWVRRILRKFAPEPIGLDGIEAYYSLFGPGETALVTEIAGTYGVALSGGSDFHGANTPNLQIGCGAGKLHVPDALLPLLKARKRE